MRMKIMITMKVNRREPMTAQKNGLRGAEAEIAGGGDLSLPQSDKRFFGRSGRGKGLSREALLPSTPGP